MKFILGEKLNMSQIFDKEGNAIPVTLVKAFPNTVLQIKTKDQDGYEAVQVGFGERSPKNIQKSQKGHFKELGNFKYVSEFRITNSNPPAGGQIPNIGDKVGVSVFGEGDSVKVSGISKAKGFQGVVKRYAFHGAPATHGTKHAHRQPGGIGGAGGRAGGRVAKGMRMAGRMGGNRVSIRNTMVVKIDSENNIMAIKGAVPGRRRTLIEIRG